MYEPTVLTCFGECIHSSTQERMYTLPRDTIQYMALFFTFSITYPYNSCREKNQDTISFLMFSLAWSAKQSYSPPNTSCVCVCVRAFDIVYSVLHIFSFPFSSRKAQPLIKYTLFSHLHSRIQFFSVAAK